VRIQPRTWIFVFCVCVCVVCCAVSGLSDEVVSRLDESYRLCVIHKLQQLGGLGPILTVVPWRKKSSDTELISINTLNAFSYKWDMLTLLFRAALP